MVFLDGVKTDATKPKYIKLDFQEFIVILFNMRVFCFLLIMFAYWQPVKAQYCMPSYNFNCTGFVINPTLISPPAMINNFWTTGGITNISNLNSYCVPSICYVNTGLQVVTTPGSTIGVNIQDILPGNFPLPPTWGTLGLFYQVWVDWNQDFIFSNSEIQLTFTSYNAGSNTGTIQIPQSVPCGEYRMRVLGKANLSPQLPQFSPCANYNYGETEDYIIKVINCFDQDQRLCYGDTAIIDLQNFTTLPNVTSYSWSPSNTISTPLSGPIVNAWPQDTTTYFITLSSPDSTWVVSHTLNVIPPLLPPNAGIDDTTCINSFHQLNGATNNLNSNSSFYWNYIQPPNTNGSVFLVPNNQILNPNTIVTQPGLYKYLLIEYDTFFVCPDIHDTLEILVSEESHYTTVTQPTCFGASDGEISITSTGTTGAVEYSIDNGLNYSTDSIFTGLSAGFYIIWSRDIKGCEGSSYVLLLDPPPVYISVSPNDTICENDTSIVWAQASNSGTSFDFHWDFTASLDNTQNFAPLDDSVISVFATNEFGCSSDTISITTVVREPISVILTPEYDSICPGKESNILVQPFGGYQPYNYVWTENTFFLPSSSSLLSVSPTVNSTYCITVSDQCGTTPKVACSEVFIYDAPILSILAKQIEGCEPFNAVLYNISDSITPNITNTAFWEIENQSYSNPDSIFHEFEIVGSYDVYLEIYSDLGCHNDSVFNDFIKVWPIPEAEFYITPNPTNNYSPVVNLINLTEGINTYHWNIPSGSPSISKEVNPKVSFEKGVVKQYVVELEVTNEYGCTHSTQELISVNSDVNIYAPNIFTPNQNAVNNTWRVYVEGIDVYDFELHIYNRWGELIWLSYDPVVEWDGTYNGSNIQEGVYIWQIKTGELNSDKHYEFNGTVTIIK